MGWILGIVVLILFVTVKGFRNFMLVGGVLIGGLIYFETDAGNANRKAWQDEQELSLARIKPYELVLSEVQIKKDHGSEELFGRVKNLSKNYSLTRLSLFFTFEDCYKKKNKETCDVIGESKEDIYINIPPGQVRTFDQYFSIPSSKPRGKIRWKYRIIKIKGEPY